MLLEARHGPLAILALYSTMSDRLSKRPARTPAATIARISAAMAGHREAARLAPMFEGEPDHRRAGEPKTCSEIGARCGGPIVKEHFGGRARFPKGKRECRDEDDRRNGSATASKRGDFCKQGERDDAVRGEAERLDRADRLPGQKPVRRHSEPCQAVDGERKGPDEACPQQIGRRRCRNPWRGNGHD